MICKATVALDSGVRSFVYNMCVTNTSSDLVNAPCTPSAIMPMSFMYKGKSDCLCQMALTRHQYKKCLRINIGCRVFQPGKKQKCVWYLPWEMQHVVSREQMTLLAACT